MKTIRDAATVIGMLERGDLAVSLGEEITGTIAEMYGQSEERPKAKIKGEVTLKLKFEMEDRAVTISGDVTSKRPKAPRGSSYFWATEDGELSLEHPQQHDMFAGPREATSLGGPGRARIADEG